MSLEERLRRAVREHPDRPAVIEARRGIVRGLTWSELESITRAPALSMDPEMAERRPLLWVDLPNTLDGVTALVAALRTRLPVVPMNPRAPVLERGEHLERLASAYGLVHRFGAPTVPRTASSGVCRGDYVLFTGGSTGRPHPVEGSLDLGGFHLLLRRTRWAAGLRQLIVGPLHHSAPFVHLLAGLMDGHTIVVQGVFEASRTIDVLHRQSIEWMQVTPSHMRRLHAEPGLSSDRLEKVRALVHTAGPCDAVTKQAWIRLLGPERIFEVYGATEQIGMTVARGDEWVARPGTVGKGFMTRIRILDDDRRPLPPKVVGRVFLRCGRRSRSAAAEHTVDGYLSLGDLGYVDDDGYLYLTGRRQGVINVGGANVYASEIEEVILRLTEVEDVAVLSAPDPDLGQTPMALVVRRPGNEVTVKAIAQHCRTLLSPYKRPKRIEFVQSLPRTETGKLERWRLTVPQG